MSHTSHGVTLCLLTSSYAFNTQSITKNYKHLSTITNLLKWKVTTPRRAPCVKLTKRSSELTKHHQIKERGSRKQDVEAWQAVPEWTSSMLNNPVFKASTERGKNFVPWFVNHVSKTSNAVKSSSSNVLVELIRHRRPVSTSFKGDHWNH